MRVGRLLPVLALVVAACADSEDAGSEPPSTPATTSPALTIPGTTASPPTAPVDDATTTPPTSPTTAPSTESVLPASWLRYGADGLYLASADGGELLVDGPIGWAASDGAGGVLFTEWDPDRFGPTWWLAGGTTDPVLVSEFDDPLIAARARGLPAAVGSFELAGCGSDGAGSMVARILTTGALVTLQCALSGPDAGESLESYGGGMYVGVEWDALHERSGRSTALRLVVRDAHGEVVDLPTNPYPDDCSPCELTAALAPDGSRLAVVHRPDAMPVRPDDRDEWLEVTTSIDAVLQVVELASGEVLFAESLPAGALPDRGSWFDGRHAVIGPDRHSFPYLAPGDRGDAVRTLQQLLVDRAADIEIDGIFGPATTEAVSSFHERNFGRARATVGPDTWAELGVPTTVVDIESGDAVELEGRIALEVILVGEPPRDLPLPSGHAEAAILRADGIGPFAFDADADADAVRAWLVDVLGEPDAEATDTGEGGWPLASCAQRRFAYWAAAGLTVGFTDLDAAASGADRCTDRDRLAGWYLVDEGPPWFAPGHGAATTSAITVWLTTSAGVGLGAGAGVLRVAEPDAEFGAWDIDEYAPGVFRTPSGLNGRVAWDPVADVQRALNERGASLAVDGTLGPRTTAALTDFQAAHDIPESGIGPRTLEELGVAVPDDAPIVYVTAGVWDWSS